MVLRVNHAKKINWIVTIWRSPWSCYKRTIIGLLRSWTVVEKPSREDLMWWSLWSFTQKVINEIKVKCLFLQEKISFHLLLLFLLYLYVSKYEWVNE
jgi:hypothetical protein